MAVHTLSPDKVKKILTTSFLGKNIYFFDEVTSTFDVADSVNPGHGDVICALRQTAGKGRMGRCWESESGGVYISLILKPHIPADRMQLMTSYCAVGVCRALQNFVPCKIKWPNDIVSKDGKKLCGILTKIKFCDGETDYINVGIGINVNTEGFGKELKYATSVRDITGAFVDENRVLAHVLAETEAVLSMESGELLKLFEKECINIGSQVRAIYGTSGDEIKGVCVGIASDGALIIQKEDGTAVNVNSGEVSVRGIYGENYV